MHAPTHHGITFESTGPRPVMPASGPDFAGPDFPTGGDVGRILAAPRLALGQWPTPIETVCCGGHALLVKRDDLSGFGRGGAKTRKIEQVLGLMRARGCDELITVIGNITNLGFDLLPALRTHGFSWRIFVQDDPPLPARLRAAIFHGITDDLLFLGRSATVSTLRIAGEWLRRRASGRKPFLLLPGASHPAGIIGNARGYLEMAQQLHAAGRPLPARIFVSAATGTTIAGFLIAENALRRAGFPPVQIVGVQVYPGDIASRTRLLLRWTERHLGLEHRVEFSRIDIRTEALAGGFGRAGPELDPLCHRVHAETGLRLDPIFGGKTWSVMERAIGTAPPAARPDLFWHCGHTPGWKALVDAVRSTHGPETAQPPIAIGPATMSPAKKTGIIALYVAAFYGGLPLFLWAFGGWLDHSFALPRVPSVGIQVAGAVLLVAGAAMVFSSVVSLFRVGQGLPISHLPPRRLVNLGSYRWTRHPHYVGYTLAFAGSGLWQASWGRGVGASLLLLALWLLYATVFEEPRLERRFGQDYVRYCHAIPILPVPSAATAFQRWVAAWSAPLEALANRVVLFRTGPVLWVTYGLFGALGGTTAAAWLAGFFLNHGWSGPATWVATTAIVTATALSSRAAWFVIPGDKPKGSFLELVRRVGFVSWGGYAGAFAVGIRIARTRGISMLRMLDVVMLAGLFTSAISRWGCLAYGCCIGRSAPWGLRWSVPEAWIHRLRPGPVAPRIPTQILSSLHAGLAGLVIAALSLRASSPGALAALGGLLYALPRFGVEHLRDEARFGRWQLTAGQLGCGVFFVLSVLLLAIFPGTPTAFWAESPAPMDWSWWLASMITAFGVIFLAYGPHWRRIGRW